MNHQDTNCQGEFWHGLRFNFDSGTFKPTNATCTLYEVLSQGNHWREFWQVFHSILTQEPSNPQMYEVLSQDNHWREFWQGLPFHFYSHKHHHIYEVSPHPKSQDYDLSSSGMIFQSILTNEPSQHVWGFSFMTIIKVSSGLIVQSTLIHKPSQMQPLHIWHIFFSRQPLLSTSSWLHSHESHFKSLSKTTITNRDVAKSNHVMIRIFIVKSDLPLGLPINFDSETFEPNNRTSEIFQDYHLRVD